MSESGLPVRVTNSDGIETGQIDVTAGVTQIVAARPGRRSVAITTHGATDVFIGGSSVASTTGFKLPLAVVIPTDAAVFGVTAGGTQKVSFLELF